MRSRVRFRHLSPFPRKSLVMAQVFGSVDRGRTEGHDQILLVLDDAIIHGFRETCNCLANVKASNRKTVRASWRSQQSACNATIFDVATQIDTMRSLERQAGLIVTH